MTPLGTKCNSNDLERLLGKIDAAFQSVESKWVSHQLDFASLSSRVLTPPSLVMQMLCLTVGPIFYSAGIYLCYLHL